MKWTMTMQPEAIHRVQQYLAELRELNSRTGITMQMTHPRYYLMDWQKKETLAVMVWDPELGDYQPLYVGSEFFGSREGEGG